MMYIVIGQLFIFNHFGIQQEKIRFPLCPLIILHKRNHHALKKIRHMSGRDVCNIHILGMGIRDWFWGYSKELGREIQVSYG